MAYTLNGTTSRYYFQRNLLGDVVAIYDTTGTLVVKYIYDAWGNCTISGETTNNALAHANPIRYRGYYYDDDTGLYYLNARYYSPKWRRFISTDSTSYLDPENVNGLNLYCYCNNDPVDYCDPSGHFSILGFAISVVTSLAFELIDDARDGGLFDGSHDWKDYLGAGISSVFGYFGEKPGVQMIWSFVGGIFDAALSGDFEEDGFGNTLLGIASSSIISVKIGEYTNKRVVSRKVSSLKGMTNNVANRKLKAMGVVIKIGSNAAKQGNGLADAIMGQPKWIGNILSNDLVGAISGGCISLGYGYVSDWIRLMF